jgi:hypothetical protein
MPPRFSSLIILAIGHCAAAATPALADDLPFVGEWDCGVATFSFSQDSYNNGNEDMPILEVQEGTDGSYTLLFADDYTVSLSGFTDNKMGWLSSSGESLECKRAE